MKDLLKMLKWHETHFAELAESYGVFQPKVLFRLNHPVKILIFKSCIVKSLKGIA